MANHINSLVQVIGNKKAKEEFAKFIDKTNEAKKKYDSSDTMTIINPLWDIDEITPPKDVFSYTTDTKWCYVEDASDDQLILVSAWQPPTGIFKQISRLITAKDPNAIITIIYDDEGPNYIGASVYYLAGKSIRERNWRLDIDEEDIICSLEELDDLRDEHGEDASIITYDDLGGFQNQFIKNEIEKIKKRRKSKLKKK